MFKDLAGSRKYLSLSEGEKYQLIYNEILSYLQGYPAIRVAQIDV